MRRVVIGGVAVPWPCDVGADAGADPGGRGALGLAREVGVAGGALDVGMAQELADHGEALAGRQRARRIGVAEVVDADVVEAGAGADAVPLCGDGGEVGSGLPAGDDPGVLWQALDGGEHGVCGGGEGDHAGTGLAVAESELACGAVHVVPAEREDLAQAAAGEHEEAQRCDGVGGDGALRTRCRLRLGLGQRSSQPPVLLA